MVFRILNLEMRICCLHPRMNAKFRSPLITWRTSQTSSGSRLPSRTSSSTPVVRSSSLAFWSVVATITILNHPFHPVFADDVMYCATCKICRVQILHSTVLLFCQCHEIEKQASNGQGSNSSRNRAQIACLFSYAFKIHVPFYAFYPECSRPTFRSVQH